MKRIICFASALMLVAWPCTLRGQSIATAGATRVDSAQPSPWRPLRIAKWTAAAGSAGAAAYGFFTNARADDRYRELERACQSDPVRCRDRLPDGRYRDTDFEGAYQDVLGLDRRSRTALIASQIGIAASVVLFLVDLGNERRPPDIPYTPSIDVTPTKEGTVQVSVSWAAPNFR